jgi:hypothetical protein
MGELMLMGGMLRGPQMLPDEEVSKCKTYREAVRLSWAMRRDKGMTKRTLGERLGAHAPHVTDYLHNDDDPSRRDLPAKHFGKWACVTGNWGVHQWLELDAQRKFVEAMKERQAA